MSQDEWDINISPGDVENFIKEHGWQNSQRIFTVLGKYSDFYDAIRSPVGKEILRDLMNRINAKLESIATNEANDQDKMEYKVCCELLESYAKKIKIYITHAKKLKEN